MATQHMTRNSKRLIIVCFVLPFLAAGALIVTPAQAGSPAPPWIGLPVRTTTHSHIPGDPINIGFEGSRTSILAAFVAIGWVQADPLSAKNDMHLAEAAIVHHLYPKAPVSRLYLFGRQEDFAVEHELGSVAKRDHARFWDTGRRDPVTGLELWIGDATRDIAVKVLRRHGVPIGTTHRIAGNIDAERDLIVTEMRQDGLVVAVVQEPGIGATTAGYNAGGDRFETDGKADVIVLKQ